MSEALAAERRAAFQDLRYDLRIIVPADRKEPVRGRVAVRVNLKSRHRVVFDFAQPSDRVVRVPANGEEARPQMPMGIWWCRRSSQRWCQ